MQVVAHENFCKVPPPHQMWLFVNQTGKPQGQLVPVVPEAKGNSDEQMQKAKTRIAELEAESAKSVRERITLQKEIANLKAENVKYMQERSSLQQEIAKWNVEYGVCNQKRDRTKGDLDTFMAYWNSIHTNSRAM